MRQERLEDLSAYYFLNNLFASSGVTVVDAFQDSDLVIPTVSIETDTLEALKYELGNKQRLNFRTWYIDIFAANKAQRDEMAGDYNNYGKTSCNSIRRIEAKNRGKL